MTAVEETFWEKGNRTKMGVYITALEMDFLFSTVKQTAKSFVFDVGGGAGRFSIPLSEKSSNATLLDLDLHSCKRLKFRNSNIDAIQSDARLIPVKEDAADIVVMIELLDVVKEGDLVINEIGRILKPNGQIILSFGNKSSIKGKLKSWRKKPYLHSYKEIVACLKKNGFKIEKQKGFNWLPFGRTSNSKLLPLMARIERVLGLRRVTRYSPWILIYAVKSS